MEKVIKHCGNCKYSYTNKFAGTICNLYGKSAVVAKNRCKMECWEKKFEK